MTGDKTMKIKSKLFSKVVSAAVSAAVVASAFAPITVFGAAEPATEDQVVYFNDFETSLDGFPAQPALNPENHPQRGLTDTGDSMYGKAMKIVQPTGNWSAFMDFNSVTTKLTEYKDFTVSFDFKAGQIGVPFNMFSQDSNARVLYFNYDLKGNIAINPKGGNMFDVSGDYTGNMVPYYIGTDWANITIHYHPNKDAKKTTLDWYVNGDYVTTSDVSGIGDESLANKTKVLGTMHMTVRKNASKSNVFSTDYSDNPDAYFYFDNLKIAYDADKAYTKVTEDVGPNSEYIPVEFTEPTKGDVTKNDVKVYNAESGEEIKVTGIDGQSSHGKINVKIEKGKITGDTEYYVEFVNGLTSASQGANSEKASVREFISNRTYFIAASSGSAEMPVIVEKISKAQGDCEDLKDVAYAQGNWKNYIITDSDHVKSVDTGINGYGTAIEYEMTMKEINGVQSIYYFRNEAGANTFVPDTSKTKIVHSIDVMRPELKRTIRINILMGKDKAGDSGVGQFFLDSYGNLVMLNGSGDWWSSDDLDDVNNKYSSKHTVYHAGMQANKFYNLTWVVDTVAETVSYFVDGNHAATVNWRKDFKGKGLNYYSGLRYQSGNTDNALKKYCDGRKIYFDNFKIGYPLSTEKLTSFRLVDRFGNTYAAKDEAVRKDIRKLCLNFSGKLNEDQSTAVITLSDGQTTQNLAGTIYDKKIEVDFENSLKGNTNYVLNVSGVKNASGDEIKAYTNSFTTMEQGEFVIEEYKLTDGAGNELTTVTPGASAKLYVKAINTTDEDITVKASINAYSGMVIGDSANKEETIVLSANNNNNIIEIPVTLPEGATYINATLTDANGKALKPALTVGADTLTEGTNTVTFESTATENSNVYGVVNGPDGVVYRGGVKADKDGKFTVKFNLAESKNSGLYTLAWADDADKNGEIKVSYANAAQTQAKVTDISGIVSATDKNEGEKIDAIEALMYDQTDEITKAQTEANRYALGITSDVSDGTDEDDYALGAEIIYSYAKGGSLTSTNSSTICNKAIYIAKIVNGKVDNLFEKSDVLELDKSGIKDFYEKTYVRESVQKNTTSRLKGCLKTTARAASKATFDGFDDKLTDAFVLAIVKDPNGESNLKEVLNYYSDEIGISKNGKDKAYRVVMNENYETYADLAKVFNENNKSEGGNGGGGSSSSGGGSIGGALIGGVTTPDKEDMQIPYPVFSDLDDVEWAQEAITRLAEKNIINGKGDHMFFPNDSVTRAEIVKMVVLAFDFKVEEGKEVPNFADVPDWANEYVNIAYTNDIITGYDENTFGSNDGIIREDLVTIIYRAALKAGVDFSSVGSSVFADNSDISDYASEAVVKLFNANIISGKDDGIFAPKDGATRAEAAKVVYNAYMY